jgi:hypothetical protein
LDQHFIAYFYHGQYDTPDICCPQARFFGHTPKQDNFAKNMKKKA